MDVEKDDLNQPSSSGESDDDDGETEAEAQIDREIEKLLRESSDTDSGTEPKQGDTSKGQKAYNRDTRYTLYDSTAMNISVLVLTCWWLRIPATYLDFIRYACAKFLLVVE